MPHALATGCAGLGLMVALIALRMPIAHAMILVGAGGIALLSGPAILFSQLKTLAFGQFAVYDLSVVPMFVLMGALAARAGLSHDLFRGARAWFGRFRGGLAMAAIAACAGFGTVSGSSLATASTMGRAALPELKRYGYAGAFATGTLAAGGVLGILIPPSVVLVIYAVLVEANIVTMFMAALLPGLVAVAFFLATIWLYVRLDPEAAPPGEAVGPAEFRAATLGLLPVAAIFGLVIGGIYAGLFTPTPAAAAGVFLVGLYGLLRRLIGWPRTPRRPARDRAHQRHDLPDPARRRAPEDLHEPRRRAPGHRGLAGRLRARADDGPGPAPRRADPARLPDG